MLYESGRTEDIPDRWREAAESLIFDPVAGGRHESHVQQPAAAAAYEFKPASTIAQTPHGPAGQIDLAAPAPIADAPSETRGILAHGDAEATVLAQLFDVSARAQTSAQEATEPTVRTVVAGSTWQVTETSFHPAPAIAGNASVESAHAGQSTGESGSVLSISVEMWSSASASLQTWSYSSLGKPATAHAGPSGEPAQSLQDAVTEAIASAVSAQGATSAQVVQALGGNSTGVTGAGIKIGVLSSSFNNLGGAAAGRSQRSLAFGLQDSDPQGHAIGRDRRRPCDDAGHPRHRA
ncbi:hypothetical protein ACRAVF_00430 [Bradyrhizobium oligotrophicum S58]